MPPKLRVARPTNDPAALLPFYRDGLGLQVICQFESHNGFDGLMLGHPQAPYHFEFTLEHGHAAGGAPSPEHLLVFYFPDASEWQTAVRRMQDCGFAPVAAHNTYWEQRGRTFADPDGYRVVLQQAGWDL